MNVKSALILTGTMALIISSCVAQAGEYKSLPNTGAHATAGAIALGGNASLYSNIGIRNGATSTNAVNIDQEKPAVSSAIAPSVGTGSDCQIATPSSIAASIFILSGSGTTGVHYNDICYAYKRGQFDVADRMMCDKSQAYAKANPACVK